MSTNKDYYKILGLKEDCTESDIKKAYTDAAKKYHPDRNPNQNDQQKFKEMSEAYNVLKDKEKRADYDAQRKYGFSANGFGGAGSGGGFNQHDINDIFGSFFEDIMGTRSGFNSRGARRKSSKINGANLKYDISITLEQAFNGLDKEIIFNTEVQCNSCSGKGSKSGSEVECAMCRGSGVMHEKRGFMTIQTTCHTCDGSGTTIKDPCTKCRGTGRHTQEKKLNVHIPKGIQSNMKVRIVGEGEAGTRGGKSGDLFVFVTVKPHSIFKVHDSDLHCRLHINFVKAILGGEVKVHTIDKDILAVNIEAGTNTGDKIRIKNYGMPVMNSTQRGDLYLYADVSIPKTISKEQRNLLEQLEKEFEKTEQPNGDSNSHKESGFFDKLKNLKNFFS